MADDDTLRSVLGNTTLKDLVHGDLLVGAAGAIGGIWLGVTNAGALRDAVGTAASLAGVVIGVVIATATIVAAFMNPSFLRKMRAIDEDPVDYLAPYLLSALLGVAGAIACVVLGALPASAPTWLLASVGGLTGFFVLYALASMVPNLTNLIRFIRLQADAAEIPDDMPAIGPGGRTRSAGAPPADTGT